MEKVLTQFRYNTRILVMNSYWLFIIPLVVSQLVIFWHMAMASLNGPSTVPQTFELVIPLLAAFLCAHTVAPEHKHRVDELAFVRPVSVLRTVVQRMLVLFAILAALSWMMLFVYKAGLKVPFDPKMVLLASLPSTLFLSMLSFAFAAAWRTPAAGIGAALAYWVADATRGAALNPLFTLHAYATAMARTTTAPTSEWLPSKAVLLALALIAAWVGVRCLGRPAAPRKWRSVLRFSGGALACVAAYLISGGVWQFTQARTVAQTSPEKARFAYVQAFAGYNYIPVAYVFGPAFAAYCGYPPTKLDDGSSAIFAPRAVTLPRLERMAARWPDSGWADDAQYEIIRLYSSAGTATAEDQADRKMALQLCRQFLDAHATSDFAPAVAARMVALARDLKDLPTMMWAYSRVTDVYAKASTPYAAVALTDAATQMSAHYMKTGDVARAAESARLAAESAPTESKPDALLVFAGFLTEVGRKEEARAAYLEVEKAVDASLEAQGLATVNSDTMTPDRLALRNEIMRARKDARAGIQKLDAPPGTVAPTPPPQPPPPRERHRDRKRDGERPSREPEQAPAG